MVDSAFSVRFPRLRKMIVPTMRCHDANDFSFVFAGPKACAMWRMFNSGKAKGQRSPAISRERREVRLCLALQLPMHVELCAKCTYCTGPAHPGNRMSIAASTVLLTISDSKFKVIRLLRNKLECVIIRYFMEIISIYIFNIDKKSTYRKKLIWRYFFTDNTGKLKSVSWKNDDTEIPTELMFNTGKAKAQRLSRYLVSGEKYAVNGFTVKCPCWTCVTAHKLYWPSENKMATYPFLSVGWVWR